MTPRLAVTQEQAEQLYVVDRGQASRSWRLRSGPVTLRLLERPTMPGPCRTWPGWCVVSRANRQCDDSGSVPIPEGTRVRIEWLERGEDWWEEVENEEGFLDVVLHPVDDVWHRVAFATLTEVKRKANYVEANDGFHNRRILDSFDFLVTLSDIKPVEADDDQAI